MNKADLIVIEAKIREIINEHLALIEVNAKSIANAKERAAKFLIVQSILASFLKTFEDDITRAVTIKEAQWAQSISCAEGKNVTEKKVNASANVDYTNAREFEEHLDSFKTWIKTHIKIFDNAHILFRQYGNER